MLKNKQLQIQLETNGYAVVGQLSNASFSALSKAVCPAPLPQGAPFYYSLLNNTFEENITLQGHIRTALHSFFEHHFEHYRTITESYLIKPALTSDELLLHQDWCYTDEKTFQAYNVWIPMQDVNEENGSLFFLPGSHLWFDTKRSGSLATGRIPSTGSAIQQQLVTVNAQKGQVLLFHPAVFHGSYPNNSLADRVIATTTVIDSNAPFLYYQKECNATLSVFEMPDDLFLKELNSLAIGNPPNTPALRKTNYTHTIVTENMLVEQLKAQHYDQ